jgi:hypothetical protein
MPPGCIFDGKPVPIGAVTCPGPDRAPNLRLLAGHANLSEYDAALTFAQMSNNAITTLQNLPGAFSELLQLTEQKYQINYTIIDLNPWNCLEKVTGEPIPSFTMRRGRGWAIAANASSSRRCG